MTPNQTAALMAALVVLWVAFARRRDGYQCPMCGARSQDSHHEDCSWK